MVLLKWCSTWPFTVRYSTRASVPQDTRPSGSPAGLESLSGSIASLVRYGSTNTNVEIPVATATTARRKTKDDFIAQY
jgi:hypothetical protein